MSEGNFSKMMLNTARGSLILMIGQIITGIISTVTIIWMTRVLGPTSYGEYTLALVPVSIAQIFQDLGMNQSLMRFSAMYRHEKRKELKLIVWTGLLFSIATSIIISSMLFLGAGVIASLFLHRPELEPLVKVAALAVLGNGGLQTTVAAIFVGYELMSLRSILQILFSVFRAVLGVSLIIIGLGSFGAVASYSAALLISGSIGFILFLKYVKFEKEQTGRFSLDTLKTLLTYGFPLSLSSIFGGILNQVYNYLLALYVATDLIGNYGATINFGIIISFITIPISSSLLPFFSKFGRDDPRLKTIFRISVKYTAMITLPIVLLIITLSSPISDIIYGASYPFVSLYLSLYLIVYIFEGLGGITLSNLISGIGETRVILNTTIISLITGGTLAVLLIPRYQVIGLFITMILTPRVGWLYQVLWVKKKINITIDWKGTIRLYTSAFVACIATLAIMNYSKLGNWNAIAIGGSLFSATYILSLLLTGAITKHDLEQLVAITGSLGPLSKVINIIVSILTRFIRE